MPSTTRIVAALPGTTLYDADGDRWDVEEDGATCHAAEGPVFCPRDELHDAQEHFGPFRLELGPRHLVRGRR